jgi:integrase
MASPSPYAAALSSAWSPESPVPNVRQPGLKRHASGQYFVMWGGRHHYLGHDLHAAKSGYAEQLKAWAAWRAACITGRAAIAAVSSRTVSQLLDTWLGHLTADVSPAARTYYAAQTTRLRDAAGHLPLSGLTTEILQSLKAGMVASNYSARSINHDLGAIRRFLAWCEDNGHTHRVRLRVIKNARLGVVTPKARTVADATAWIARVGKADPRLLPWLCLAYLTGARPVEVGRMARREGAWWQPTLGQHGACVYAVANKSARTQHTARYIVLSPEALAWFHAAGPHWSTASGYWQAVERAGGTGGSHFLRSTAWSALRATGLPRDTVQLLLGHSIPGAWRHYEVLAWHTYQPLMARLTLLPTIQPPNPLPPAWVPPQSSAHVGAG